MNLKFSFLLIFFISNAHANLIDISYMPGMEEQAYKIKVIFTDQYNIPISLIDVTQIESCKDGNIDFCIDERAYLNINLKKPEDFKKSLSSFNILNEGQI